MGKFCHPTKWSNNTTKMVGKTLPTVGRENIKHWAGNPLRRAEVIKHRMISSIRIRNGGWRIDSGLYNVDEEKH